MWELPLAETFPGAGAAWAGVKVCLARSGSLEAWMVFVLGVQPKQACRKGVKRELVSEEGGRILGRATVYLPCKALHLTHSKYIG